MKVNGVDIAKYGATLWRMTPGKRSISNNSARMGWQWSGIMDVPEFELNTYQLELRLKGGSREELWGKAGQILVLFSGVCDVEAGEVLKNRKLKLSLCGVEQKEYGPSKDSWHILSLECRGYEYRDKYLKIQHLDFSGEPNIEETKEAVFALPGDGGIGVLEIEVRQILKAKADITSPDYELTNFYVPPIYGKITVSGVCRNNTGKDIGAITFESTIIKRWMDEGCTNLWMELGIDEIQILGKSGKVSLWSNSSLPAWGSGFHPKINMPSIPMVGPLDKELKVQVLNKGNRHHDTPKKFEITVSFTPIYL